MDMKSFSQRLWFATIKKCIYTPGTAAEYVRGLCWNTNRHEQGTNSEGKIAPLWMDTQLKYPWNVLIRVGILSMGITSSVSVYSGGVCAVYLLQLIANKNQLTHASLYISGLLSINTFIKHPSTYIKLGMTKQDEKYQTKWIIFEKIRRI